MRSCAITWRKCEASETIRKGAFLYPIIHKRPQVSDSFERIEMLWERYPQYRERTVFSSMEELLAEHESWQKDFEDVREEYESGQYDRFLVRLSWADLPYRYATKQLIEGSPSLPVNPYVEAFMEQFRNIDTDHKACFLFPESFISQFFVITDVCRRAETFHPIRNLFPDEEKTHYLAVFDKENMDDVLLLYHLLYTNTTEDLYGGYSLYDYSLPWYQNHLWEDGIVLRSPYLPDALAKFLTQVIMPLFQWWYTDLMLYEEKDGLRTDWRLQRTKIRTRLTAEGVIQPKWKHELTLFHLVREKYPDTLYQFRPEWLGRQSLDLFIPSLKTAIEYQGIQHFLPVGFFGGEEALATRQDLDRQKRQLCEENDVRLIGLALRMCGTAGMPGCVG